MYYCYSHNTWIRGRMLVGKDASVTAVSRREVISKGQSGACWAQPPQHSHISHREGSMVTRVAVQGRTK